MKQELLLKQYDLLREEIMQKIKALELLSIYGILGTAVSWSWILTNKASFTNKLTLFIPLAAALLFFSKAFSLKRSIIFISEHLARIENHSGLGPDLAWETHCRQAGETRLSRWEDLFWGCLCLLNGIAPAIFGLL